MRNILFVALAFTFLSACASEKFAADHDGTNSASNSGKSDRFDDGTGSNFNTSQDTTGLADGAEPEAEPNPFAPALDPDLHHVVFPESLAAPAYDYPRISSGFRLSGTEFWQKWSGGHSPTYSYTAGTDFGRRCMYASALRFKALMNDPPEGMVALKEGSDWSGSFFNWNDDYSESTWGDGSSARLWAWRTTLIKWISQTNIDGSCYLPTAAMLEELASDCLQSAETGNGSIQGCSAP